MVWLPFSHNTALCLCYTQGGGLVSGNSLVGFTRPVPNAQRTTTNWSKGSALSWEKGRTCGKKKAAQVLKNIQIHCVRLAGSASPKGQDSPLKWGDELQPWVGPWTVPQPVWATGTRPGPKQRHQPSAILGPGIDSSWNTQSVSPWLRAHPQHKAYPLDFLLCLWCSTHNSHNINTSSCSLEKPKSGWDISLGFREWSYTLVSITTYSAVLIVCPFGPCAHSFYH